MKTYTVYYWMGGAEVGEWRKCLPVTTREEALAQTADINRGGRVAHYADTAQLENVGLPDGPPSSR